MEENEIAQKIARLGSNAQRAMSISTSFIKEELVPINLPTGKSGAKWPMYFRVKSGHEDVPPSTIEVGAVAMASTILVIGGLKEGSDLYSSIINTLLYLQNNDGGWPSQVDITNDEAHREESLVLDTFYALRSLAMLGKTTTKEFNEGIRWLRNAINRQRNGWGYQRNSDSPPEILPTTAAVRALSIKLNDRQTINAIEKGLEWLSSHELLTLLNSRNNNQGISAVHVALLITAFIESGRYTKYTTPVSIARDWLIQNTDNRITVTDYYVIPISKNQQRSVNHVNFPEGIILQGLLKAGVNIIDENLQSLVEKLLQLQDDKGAWRSEYSAKSNYPIYAIADACLGLQLFTEEVHKREYDLEIYHSIQKLNIKVKKVQDDCWKKIEELQEDCQNHDNVLSELKTQSEGLLLFKPLIWLTRQSLHHKALSVIIFAFIVISMYSLSITFGDATNHTYMVLTFVVNTLLGIATILGIYLAVKKEKKDE